LELVESSVENIAPELANIVHQSSGFSVRSGQRQNSRDDDGANRPANLHFLPNFLPNFFFFFFLKNPKFKF